MIGIRLRLSHVQAVPLPFHERISATEAKDARSTGQLDQGPLTASQLFTCNVALLCRRQDPASEARDD